VISSDVDPQRCDPSLVNVITPRTFRRFYSSRDRSRSESDPFVGDFAKMFSRIEPIQGRDGGQFRRFNGCEVSGDPANRTGTMVPSARRRVSGNQFRNDAAFGCLTRARSDNCASESRDEYCCDQLGVVSVEYT